jgi:hypothetical protein
MLKVGDKRTKQDVKKLKTLQAPSTKFGKGLLKRKPEGNKLGLKRRGSNQQQLGLKRRRNPNPEEKKTKRAKRVQQDER